MNEVCETPSKSWVTCTRCMKIHLREVACLEGKEIEEGHWYPCLWVTRKWSTVPFLDIPQTKEALIYAQDEMLKRNTRFWDTVVKWLRGEDY